MDNHHPDKITDTIIHGCQVKNIMYYTIVIDNSLLSRSPVDGIKDSLWRRSWYESNMNNRRNHGKCEMGSQRQQTDYRS